VGGCEDSVHATAASNHSRIGTGTTKVSDHNKLVSNGSLGSGIVSQDGSNRLVDELENLEASGASGSGKGFALSIGEVGGNGDDGSVDVLTEVVGGGLLQTAEMTSCDLRDGDGVEGLAGGIPDGEGNSGVDLLRVR
jgi:hypothetical protein